MGRGEKRLVGHDEEGREITRREIVGVEVRRGVSCFESSDWIVLG